MKRLLPLLLMPNIAFAEVMDKEPSLLFVWAMVVFPSLAAYFVGRYIPFLLLLVVPLPSLFYIAQLIELTDPFVGLAMQQEAGLFYVVSSWVAPMFFIFAAGLGIGYWYAHKQVNTYPHQSTGTLC